MSIASLLSNTLTRLRLRNDLPTRVSTLASQAADCLQQLSVALDRYTDQERGLAPRVQSQKAQLDEMDLRFQALWGKLVELQAAADQLRKKR